MANENKSAQRGADKPKRNGWRVFGRVIGTIVLVGVLTVLANPVGGHAIARAAYRIGIRPERELAVDDLAEPDACVEPEAEAAVEKEGEET